MVFCTVSAADKRWSGRGVDYELKSMAFMHQIRIYWLFRAVMAFTKQNCYPGLEKCDPLLIKIIVANDSSVFYFISQIVLHLDEVRIYFCWCWREAMIFKKIVGVSLQMSISISICLFRDLCMLEEMRICASSLQIVHIIRQLTGYALRTVVSNIVAV